MLRVAQVHKISYARVTIVDQDPQLQLDVLAGEGCLKKDTATGTRPKDISSAENGAALWVNVRHWGGR